MITGIVAEFNPFHNGHAYLLEKARGLKIVAMSGNFVQRGEPALVDKWTRAQMALENGADIVVELPFLVSVQAADHFAKGAIAILARLGVDNVTFGTEEVIDYQKISTLYVEKQQEMANYLSSLPETLSYPQKTQAMWEKFAGLSFSGSTPNHVLGLAYTKAASAYGIALSPIQRQGAAFHSEEKETNYASATAIRKHISDQAFVDKFSPSAQLLLSCPQVSWENYFSYLKYRILSQDNLTTIYQVNQEMAQRIKVAIRTASSLDELVEKVATKRYTKARVRRMLTYILVNAKETTLPEEIHVLGFNARGQKHLKSIKKSVPLITKIGQKPWDELTQKADDIYRLGHSDIKEQNFGRIPVRIDNS